MKKDKPKQFEHTGADSKPTKLVVYGPPIPSLNRLFSMGHWQRKKLRDEIHAAVSQSLAIASGSSTKTTSASSTTSTDSDTMASSKTTLPNTSLSPSVKSKSPRAKKSAQK